MTVHARLPLPRDASGEERLSFAHDVLEGLTAEPKRIPPKYFYDERGSQLFGEITGTPEYYPTRTELAILTDNAAAIARHIPAGAAMVEFGSGSSTKARILLAAARSVAAYVPVDISGEFLAQEAAALKQDRPDLRVLPVVADFTAPFDLPAAVKAMPHVGFFPGSTIGNFEPHEAAAFLRNAGRLLGRGATLVIGVDLVKDAKVLNRAYNDAAGVTAAFNLNLLHRINRELGANIDVDAFLHRAFYNRERRRVEMHLASRVRQKVKIGGRTIDFRKGETIHTENSYKYTPELFRALADGAGWRTAEVWLDRDGYFSVHALISPPLRAAEA
jgi:dimethylhistidine N-methyltransferase